MEIRKKAWTDEERLNVIKEENCFEQSIIKYTDWYFGILPGGGQRKFKAIYKLVDIIEVEEKMQEIVSKKFRDKRTGEIVTVFKITDIEHMEEVE